MGLSEFLERESKQHRLTVALSSPRRVDSLEKADDGTVCCKTRLGAKGVFRRSYRDDSVRIDAVDKELTALPLSVDLKFLPLEAVSKLEAYGVLDFWPAINTRDGVVDEPDSLTLTVFLPAGLLDRFEREGQLPALALRVGDLHVTHEGAMPGLSEKVWRTAENKYLRVTECLLFDEESGGEAETRESERATPLPEEPRPQNPAVIRLDPAFERRLIFWLGLIAGLLIVLLLK